jgi:hypothetical protein
MFSTVISRAFCLLLRCFLTAAIDIVVFLTCASSLPIAHAQSEQKGQKYRANILDELNITLLTRSSMTCHQLHPVYSQLTSSFEIQTSLMRHTFGLHSFCWLSGLLM